MNVKSSPAVLSIVNACQGGSTMIAWGSLVKHNKDFYGQNSALRLNSYCFHSALGHFHCWFSGKQK